SDPVFFAVVGHLDDVPRLARKAGCDLRLDTEARDGRRRVLVDDDAVLPLDRQELECDVLTERAMGRNPYLVHRPASEETHEFDFSSDYVARPHAIHGPG